MKNRILFCLFFILINEIVCTGGHPFYVTELDKFIPARELEVGTKLLLSSGERAIIEAIQVEQLETLEATYNFEVEDFHTYYVTDSNVLVHNKCTPSNSKNYSAEKIADKYNISVEQYHHQVKPEILKRVKPNYNVGSNPNIMLNKFGEIAYQGAKGIGFQDTGLSMSQILNILNLR